MVSGATSVPAIEKPWSELTRNPSTLWIVQQMREAWPYASAPRFLIFDRDSKFSGDVVSAAKDLRSRPGSRDYPERHLKRLMAEYVRYYHEDRTRLGCLKMLERIRGSKIAKRNNYYRARYYSPTFERKRRLILQEKAGTPRLSTC